MSMMKDRVVLVTGGTMGIGLATGLAYGREGAHAILTHRWGSADEDEVRERFAKAGAPAPLILEADVANDEDTEALFSKIAAEHDYVDVLVSNVAFALKTSSPDAYNKRGLFQSIDFSAWPLWSYSQGLKRHFGRFPKRIVGLSSDGPDSFNMNYDFVAMSKAVLETMCRYLNFHYFNEQVRVNIVRSRLVRTESFDATFGTEFHEFLEKLGGFEDCYTTPEEIANVVLALGSGLLDAVGGQVIMADKGFSFFDNLMGIAERAKTRKPSLYGGKDQT